MVYGDSTTLKFVYDEIFDSKFEVGATLQHKLEAFEKHRHDYIELVFQIKGSSVQTIDDVDITLNENEFVIINQEQYHENYPTESTVVNLIITDRFLTSLIIESSFDLDLVDLKYILTNFKFIGKYSATVIISSIMKDVYYNITHPDTQFYYIKQKAIITRLIIEFFDEIAEYDLVNIEKEKIDVTTYIRENLKTASLNEYAQLLHYSPSKVSTQIKNDYQLTFIEILHEMRLKEAANLLQNTTMKIDDIVYAIGYQNKTHFYQLFRRKYSLTPSQFKQQYSK